MQRSFTLFIVFFFAALLPAAAGESKAQPIRMEVDATEVTRRIIHAKLHIPVEPGEVTLVYPKWIPGKHSPAGPIPDVVGLKIQAGKEVLPWKRDPVDGYAVHVDVPKGVKTLGVALDYVASGSGIGEPKISPKLAVIEWDQYLLYPRGRAASEITFEPSFQLPEGWKFGSSMPVKSEGEGRVEFEPIALDMLIDSPVLCGEYFTKIRLAPNVEPPHYLILAGDSPESIELPDDLKAKYDRLVEEALALFGCYHYREYCFLLALSDHIPGGGLEHHESSDNRLPEKAIIDGSLHTSAATLLPHEMVHSWNGKYRRPASMVVKDFQEPHKTAMLWVYEGLTSYLDDVLTARAGLRTPEETRDYVALTAEAMNNQKGRLWRPLEDTSAGAHVIYQAGSGWNSWRRGLDYYDEGMLIWLEADAIIRQRTKGKKSLDDWCRVFFGGKSGTPSVKGYTFEELVASLNEVCEYDWEGHLIRRVRLPNEEAPLGGIVKSGWKLTTAEKPTQMFKLREQYRKAVDLSSSIGLVLKQDGTIADVIKGSPAEEKWTGDKQGDLLPQGALGPGMKIIGVNGRKFTPDRLRGAVAGSKQSGKLVLLVENEDFFHTHVIPYNGGARFPVLERTSLAEADMLGDILRPRVREKSE